MSQSNCSTCARALTVEVADGCGLEANRAMLSRTYAITDELLPGTILAQRYRIVTLLRRGGMAEVYRADDLILEQAVALKFFPSRLGDDQSAIIRFRREVRLARQISHPNVCRVFDIIEAEGRALMSMEFVDGEDLDLLFRRVGRFNPEKSMEVAHQLCAGLAAAHQAGVLHRDLKPANIMLDSHGVARIADFGLGSLVAEARATRSDAGTPGYMAPEQIAGKDVSTRSDIYSLGLVLYEIFTGRRMFEARASPRTKWDARQFSTLPFPRIPDLHPAVEGIILRCLDPDPAKRPSSALEVAAALPSSHKLIQPDMGDWLPQSAGITIGDQLLGPKLAWPLLLSTLCGLTLLLVLASRLTGVGLARSQLSDQSMSAIFTWFWCIGLQCLLALVAMTAVLRRSSFQSRTFPPTRGHDPLQECRNKGVGAAESHPRRLLKNHCPSRAAVW